jgi:hypothetical protein
LEMHPHPPEQVIEHPPYVLVQVAAAAFCAENAASENAIKEAKFLINPPT